MKPTATAPAPTSSLALDEMDVIVKFYFSNPSLIPAGISEKKRQPDEVLDFGRHHTAEEKNEFNRIREGRVDTGDNVINNLSMVQAAMLRKGLANNGYRLVDAHWFRKDRDGKTSQYVVVLSFKFGASESVELARDTITAIRHLANTVWQYCHVWRNEVRSKFKDDKNKKAPNYTVNFVGLQQPGAKQKFSLCTRNGSFNPTTAFALVDEEDE